MTLAWQPRQNELADLALREWGGFDELRAAVASRLARASVTAPVRRSDHWGRVDCGPFVVAASPTGPGRTLVDPGDATLDRFFPSPRGTYVGRTTGAAPRGPNVGSWPVCRRRPGVSFVPRVVVGRGRCLGTSRDADPVAESHGFLHQALT